VGLLESKEMSPFTLDCASALEIPESEHVSPQISDHAAPQYKLLDQISVIHSGRTLNMSRGGIFFEANESLPLHKRIKVVLEWPFLLEGSFHETGRSWTRCPQRYQGTAVKVKPSSSALVNVQVRSVDA